MPQPRSRAKIIDAFAAVAAERAWPEVTLHAVADRAGVTLAQLRAGFDGRFDLLADFVRRIDEAVLSRIEEDLIEEGPREQLFDILFSRIEALAPHRSAIRNIADGARRDPCLALALNRIERAAMAWMLAGAGISAAGPKGAARSQGLTLLWARVLRVWLRDDDPDLGRTMSELDRCLRRAEQAAIRVERVCGMVRCFKGERRAQSAPVADAADLAEGHPS
jgi:AcrR family transcriptional regulator